MTNFTSKTFEEQVMNLVNNCGLTISEAYFIIETIALRLKLLRNELAMKEYWELCNKNDENVTLKVDNIQEKSEIEMKKQEE